MVKKFLNKKGQFFSPDLVIAFIVFLTYVTFFLIGTTFIVENVHLVDSKNRTDSVAYSVLNSLIYSSGSPSNWETKDFSEIVSFGLSEGSNNLNTQKIDSLFYYLDNNYSSTKEKLGMGIYSINMLLIDSNGSVVASAGEQFVSPTFIQNYDRFVLVGDEMFIIRGVVALDT